MVAREFAPTCRHGPGKFLSSTLELPTGHLVISERVCMDRSSTLQCLFRPSSILSRQAELISVDSRVARDPLSPTLKSIFSDLHKWMDRWLTRNSLSTSPSLGVGCGMSSWARPFALYLHISPCSQRLYGDNWIGLIPGWKVKPYLKGTFSSIRTHPATTDDCRTLTNSLGRAACFELLTN